MPGAGLRSVLEPYVAELRRDVRSLEEAREKLVVVRQLAPLLSAPSKRQVAALVSSLREEAQEGAQRLAALADEACRRATALFLREVLGVEADADSCPSAGDAAALAAMASMPEEVRRLVREVVAASGDGYRAALDLARHRSKLGELAAAVEEVRRLLEVLGVDARHLLKLVVASTSSVGAGRGLEYAVEALNAVRRRLARLLEAKREVESSLPEGCGDLCAALRASIGALARRLAEGVAGAASLEALARAMSSVQAGLERARALARRLAGLQEGRGLGALEAEVILALVERGHAPLEELVAAVASKLGTEPSVVASGIYELCRRGLLECRVALPQ